MAAPTTDRFVDDLPPADGGFRIGVVDTGLVKQDGHAHPWLAGHVNDQDQGVQDSLPDGDLGVDDGHGTFVTGLILREAPRAAVRMVRALDLDGRADRLDELVAGAVRNLLTDPLVRLINLSFGGREWESQPPQGIRDALAAAGDAGVVVVAPAGNVPSATPVWPGAFAYEFDHVISVGAVDETPGYLQGGPPPRASFSNSGYWVKAYASGVNVLGPFCEHTDSRVDVPFTGWARWSGTSFAAATVAGVIARTAMDTGLAAPAAALQVLAKRHHLIYETGWAVPAAYVPAAESTWSTAGEPGLAAGRLDADD